MAFKSNIRSIFLKLKLVTVGNTSAYFLTSMVLLQKSSAFTLPTIHSKDLAVALDLIHLKVIHLTLIGDC